MNYYRYDFIVKEEGTTMNKKQVIEELKNILMSNELSKQQENALIIAIAEFVKEWFKMLEVKQERGVYYLYIDGKFYCSCDSNREVEEERESLQRNNIILNWNNKALTENVGAFVLQNFV